MFAFQHVLYAIVVRSSNRVDHWNAQGVRFSAPTGSAEHAPLKVGSRGNGARLDDDKQGIDDRRASFEQRARKQSRLENDLLGQDHLRAIEHETSTTRRRKGSLACVPTKFEDSVDNNETAEKTNENQR